MSDDLYTRPAFHAPGRPYMSNAARAAQFSAYKSLVGYEEMIIEAAAEKLSGNEREIIPDLEYLNFEE